MYKTFADLRAKRAKGENGFTLIELLVVVVILGVLIAIAIPVYLNYRKGANDAAAESDVRNAISVLETCNASDGKYPIQATAVTWGSTSASASTTPSPCTSQTINTSNGTTIKYKSNAAGSCYFVVATNQNGAGKYWSYNSTTGGGAAASTADIYNTPTSC